MSNILATDVSLLHSLVSTKVTTVIAARVVPLKVVTLLQSGISVSERRIAVDFYVYPFNAYIDLYTCDERKQQRIKVRSQFILM